MELATWILVVILSVFLLIFLIIGIVLMVKLIGLTTEAKKVVLQSQDIAEKADDIADNVRDMTTVGGLVKHFVNNIVEDEPKKRGKGKK